MKIERLELGLSEIFGVGAVIAALAGSWPGCVALGVVAGVTHIYRRSNADVPELTDKPGAPPELPEHSGP